ncbi:glycosyltransferase family protein [bacterium]|jgi:spore coat polysaccharide biosynthesis protein SpsF (cytidylyltransferase family)|nr:glycosyltransferase family protein [bacterium]
MIIVIIQARMGSFRLPNKVMKKILNKPLIDYLLERVATAKRVDKIVLATTIKSEDDYLAEHVNSLGYDVFRGSDADVLSRYYHAFNKFKSKTDKSNAIVRITGDCPLIDAQLIDKVITEYQERNIDYVALSPDFAEGLDVEIFSETLLTQAFNKAKNPSEREHVALFFHNNKKLFNMYRVQNKTNDSCYRITVDEEQDFIVIKEIIEHFYSNNLVLNTQNIKHYLDRNPNIYNLNSHIVRNEGLQKSLEKENEKF